MCMEDLFKHHSSASQQYSNSLCHAFLHSCWIMAKRAYFYCTICFVWIECKECRLKMVTTLFDTKQLIPGKHPLFEAKSLIIIIKT